MIQISRIKTKSFPTRVMIDKSEGEKGYTAFLFAALVGTLRDKCKGIWSPACILIKKPKLLRSEMMTHCWKRRYINPHALFPKYEVFIISILDFVINTTTQINF